MALTENPKHRWRAMQGIWRVEREVAGRPLHVPLPPGHGQAPGNPEYASALLRTTQGQKTKSLSTEHNGDMRPTCLARGTTSIASKGGYWGRAHELLLAAGDGRLIYANIFNHKVITF